MPSGGTFGGGGSVQWRVQSDNNKKHDNKEQGKGYLQTGADHNAGSVFTITIALPNEKTERDKLLKILSDALAGSSASVSFPLPIDEANSRQIQVEWTSKSTATAN